jgi:hypothetical protein
MPEARKHCYCPTCKGILVSARTARRHTAQAIASSNSVGSFSTWVEQESSNQRNTPESNGDDSDSDDSDSDDMDSDTSVPPGLRDGGPSSKRRRFDATVCYTVCKSITAYQ